jgi:hypothetical protein
VNERPILVTGSHRSGSTWVGRMLAAAPGVAYIHEPFSIHHRRGVLDVHFDVWFPYICGANEGPYLSPVRDMLAFRYRTDPEIRSIRSPRDAGRLLRDRTRFARARRAHARPLVKDPIAVFSAEWLSSRFDVDPVVLVRHPAAFVSSLTRLGWTHPFEHFVSQPLLMRDLLDPFADEVREFAAVEHPLLDQAILLWKLIHHTIAGYRDRHPEWTFVRHEDLARDPLGGFEKMYARLDLRSTDHVERSIARHSDASNPTEVRDAGALRRDSASSVWTWKSRLSADEIARVRAGVGPIAKEFYDDDDW